MLSTDYSWFKDKDNDTMCKTIKINFFNNLIVECSKKGMFSLKIQY